jgi:hypothetical protein
LSEQNEEVDRKMEGKSSDPLVDGIEAFNTSIHVTMCIIEAADPPGTRVRDANHFSRG